MVLRTAFNDKGYSLIEVLIAMVLTALVFAGLLKSSLLVMNTNLDNLLRDEAASVADQQMTQLRNTPFNAVPAGTVTSTSTRQIRNVATFSFTTSQTIVPLDANNKSATITVSWLRSGQTTTRSQTYATLLRYKP